MARRKRPPGPEMPERLRRFVEDEWLGGGGEPYAMWLRARCNWGAGHGVPVVELIREARAMRRVGLPDVPSRRRRFRNIDDG